MITTRNRKRRSRDQRRGAIAVLAAIMLILVFAMVAFAVDVGYLLLARSEAQRSADAAAMAAAWELVNDEFHAGEFDDNHDSARVAAIQYAQLNAIGKSAPTLDANWTNHTEGDIVMGRLINPSNPLSDIVFGNASQYNAVRIKIRRNADKNGEVPFFFGNLLGVNSAAITAEATAAFMTDVSGFRVTETSGKSSLMPFVIHEDVWNAYLTHPSSFSDGHTYAASSDTVTSGGDGTPEIRMFAQGTNGDNGNGNGNGSGSGQIAPGNFGTVDIGNVNNSATDLLRQIREGPSMADMNVHGGELSLNPVTKTMNLNGDTGMTVSMKEALEEIVGQPRTIMTYREVVETGNNANFTITGFVGVTVVDFALAGSDQHILIQPTTVVDRTAVSTDIEGNSHFVSQPARLVR
jgi:Flp pilus assembly protein TadG